MSPSATQYLAQLPEGFERAIVYGDGLFETVLIVDGTPPLWHYHKQRLQVSLLRLGIKADITVIEQQVFSLATRTQNALLRIVVARSGGQRGYDPRSVSGCVFTIDNFALPAYTKTLLESGVALHLCRYVLPRNPVLAGIKHINRLDQVMAASEWNRQCEQEGLLLDDTGAVIEGTMSNVFIITNGMLQTPLLNDCGVAGVMRDYIINTLAPELSLAVTVRRLTLNDILASDECFLCNSVFGIWPVSKIGVASLNGHSVVTQKIIQAVLAKGYGRLYA
jgi:4-amino-4-deoxychorismate lyase